MNDWNIEYPECEASKAVRYSLLNAWRPSEVGLQAADLAYTVGLGLGVLLMAIAYNVGL